MALAGNIKEFGLADIFQIVSLQQKTGELIVEGKDGSVHILLESGFIVGASATFRSIEERLERALEHSEAINKFQLKRALETQKKTLQPLWTVLAETKAVNVDTLKNLLSQQIHETIYHVLRWTEGEYRFEPKKNVEYDRELIAPINTEFLVMEGFRITDEWPEVEKVITSFQLMVRRAANVTTIPPDLSEGEAKLFKLLSQDRSVQELIDIGQQGEFETCQNLYGLMKRKIVERVEKKGKVATQKRASSLSIGDIFLKIAAILLIIVVLAGLVFSLRFLPNNLSLIHKPNLGGLEVMKQFATQSEMARISQQFSRYYLLKKQWPASPEELVNERMISSPQLLRNPWGEPYAVTTAQQQVTINTTVNAGASTGKQLSVTIAW
ncbi:conserved uncharacterized protein [Candidatus Moduliflexus flocculans]|uniref:Conserved uncharacterized protein n=1 Tax=Candidatus Moduliflexus flocculans TaxID=1499966 RepID=A0A081BT32_9BACT|nr:conserved uncharacterized protein [Candidatus Moduliflexus flocculans]